MTDDEHRRYNLANWEDRVPLHLASPDYDIAGLSADPPRLSPVVADDAPRLGDVRRKRLVHLQCHIGRDTLSWAALGADVTGVDFSPAAIAAARRLAEQSGLPGRFIEAELYETPDVLVGERFDVVYTGVGALNWLPDIARWARVVAQLLAPGGLLYLHEVHPMLWTLDDDSTVERLLVRYPYFETRAPMIFDDPSTYASGGGTTTHTVTHEWNHGLGEIVTAVLDAGLHLTGLTEHRQAYSRPLPGMVAVGEGRWALPGDDARLPLSYILTAVAPAPS